MKGRGGALWPEPACLQVVGKLHFPLGADQFSPGPAPLETSISVSTAFSGTATQSEPRWPWVIWHPEATTHPTVAPQGHHTRHGSLWTRCVVLRLAMAASSPGAEHRAK